MKRIGILFFISLFFIQSSIAQKSTEIDNVFTKTLAYPMISRGNNFRDFSVRKDSVDFFLCCLHDNISIKSFKNKTHFSDEKINELTTFLISKNWLHKINGVYKPTVFIATEKDGKALFDAASPISKDISLAIEKNLQKIKTQFATTDISKSYTFDECSFFLLSDVLLDSWQIDNVEKDFLKQSERPKRHGMNYYQAIMENTNSNKESFGIYGNQMMSKDNRTFGIYGNNRYNESKETIVYHNVTKKDNQIFSEIASSFLPDLLTVLEKHRKYSETIFTKLGYSNEITFAEFYIFWYHFIYTQSTDEMAKNKILQLPVSGNFYYEMVD